MTRRHATRFHCQWTQPEASRWFRAAVSLHSHTLHSKELLDFVPRMTARVPFVAEAVRRLEAKFLRMYSTTLDYKRAWWTPPLCRVRSLGIERAQITRELHLQPIVSLSDHDTIEAFSRHPESELPAAPVSIEWTVPYRSTFFHLGIHNLPAGQASSLVSRMNQLTRQPSGETLADLLAELDRTPGVLIVWNHPLWDEKGVGFALHRECVESFGRQHLHRIHALEWNGLRPWKENRLAQKLASEWQRPVISGGDRHTREPNSVLNLTHAATFAEFATEIREGKSDVLLMPEYRESFPVRLLHRLQDALADDPAHTLGWVRWSDRVFYQGEDGVTRPLSEWWPHRQPKIVRHFVQFVQFTRRQEVCSALRLAFPERGELTP